MDWKKIIITFLFIVLLLFGGYSVYRYWLSGDEKITTNEQEIIELLQKQQGAIIKLQTEIADVEKRVVTDTLKETIVVRESETYEGVKDELIKLRENESENKEEIKELREVFENRIDEFQESPDKIMVKSGDEKVVIYEDSEGNLVSLNEGVEIIRHRKTEPLLEKDLEVGQTVEELNDNWAFSILYNGGFSPAISYSVLDWKDLSLNATSYDFEQPKLGADVSYNIKGNLEIGAGVGLLDIMQTEMIRDYYVRFGIRVNF
ncbi:MAG: hypothetical protein PHQ86_08780 [Dehalococcoidales bacterium]|nr:hypothetical protein [Dehalococcoidales bacterium]